MAYTPHLLKGSICLRLQRLPDASVASLRIPCSRMAGKVRAIVRSESKGEPWAAKGCEVALASLDDAESLTKALTDVEGAFILFPPLYDTEPSFPDLQPRIDAVRRALAQARPRKVVVLSTIGAEASQPNLLNALGQVEAGLSELTLPITYLRAAWFIENAEWSVAAARDEGVLRFLLSSHWIVACP